MSLKEIRIPPGFEILGKRFLGRLGKVQQPAPFQESEVGKVPEIIEVEDGQRIQLEEGVIIPIHKGKSRERNPRLTPSLETGKAEKKNSPTQKETESETEKLRATVVGVREFRDLDEKEFDEYAWFYYDLLRRRPNIPHFVGIPKLDELKGELRKKEVHGLAVMNALNKPIGFSLIRDSEPGQSDSWIEKLVILNSLQNKERFKEEGKKTKGYRHVGHDALEKIVEWGFRTKTHDGRNRESLHAAIIMKVPHWERVDELFTHFFGKNEEGKYEGFKIVSRLENQVKIRFKGKDVYRSVTRFMIDRERWKMELILREQKNNSATNSQ